MNYQKIYTQIIEKAKNRTIESYTERHHVIPRCLGGSDDLENIVALTAREHFICHWLLSRMYPNDIRLAHAFLLMCKVKGRGQQRYTPSSRIFEEARQRVSTLKRGKQIPHLLNLSKGIKRSKESLAKRQATRVKNGANARHAERVKGNKFATKNLGRKQTNEEKMQRSLSQPNSRSCIIDGKEYASVSLAARELGIPQKTIWARLRSKNYPNYNYSC